MKTIKLFTVLLACLPAIVLADTASEITALIEESAAYSKANLQDPSDAISSEGSLHFWSSGGLLQNVPAGSEPSTYTQISLTPKHINVVTLVEGQAAVAMYYSEGSYTETNGAAVDHYMTRITEAYVKEDGEWKLRAAHYSPIAAGQGTTNTAVD
jgi:hypothetical protein